MWLWAGFRRPLELLDGDFVAEVFELGEEPSRLAFGVMFAELIAAEVAVQPVQQLKATLQRWRSIEQLGVGGALAQHVEHRPPGLPKDA